MVVPHKVMLVVVGKKADRGSDCTRSITLNNETYPQQFSWLVWNQIFKDSSLTFNHAFSLVLSFVLNGRRVTRWKSYSIVRVLNDLLSEAGLNKLPSSLCFSNEHPFTVLWTLRPSMNGLQSIISTYLVKLVFSVTKTSKGKCKEETTTLLNNTFRLMLHSCWGSPILMVLKPLDKVQHSYLIKNSEFNGSNCLYRTLFGRD